MEEMSSNVEEGMEDNYYDAMMDDEQVDGTVETMLATQQHHYIGDERMSVTNAAEDDYDDNHDIDSKKMTTNIDEDTAIPIPANTTTTSTDTIVGPDNNEDSLQVPHTTTLPEVDMMTDADVTANTTTGGGGAKRPYQKRQPPALKWKDVEKEMKSIIYDEVLILWYQLERRRTTLSSNKSMKLSRQKMAEIILTTLDNPPFLNRQRIYSIVNKHSKEYEMQDIDPSDCTQLLSIPKIFEALAELEILQQVDEAQQQHSQSPVSAMRKRSNYDAEEEEDDDDDEFADNYGSDHYSDPPIQSKNKKGSTVKTENNSKGGKGIIKGGKAKTVVKGKRTVVKAEPPAAVSVTKEMKKLVLRKAIDLYRVEKDKMSNQQYSSTATSSAIPRSLISDILMALGSPKWLTRNDIYTAIHKYNKTHGTSTKAGATVGIAAVTKVGPVSASVSTKNSIDKKKTSVSSSVSKTKSKTKTNKDGMKREKLTSTQKKARLQEAIEIATQNYLTARLEVHPNRVREGVLATIISQAIEQVRLPPKFSVLITPISIRTRVSRLEQQQQQQQLNPQQQPIDPSATTAILDSEAINQSQSAVEMLVAEVDSALSAIPRPVMTTTIAPTTTTTLTTRTTTTAAGATSMTAPESSIEKDFW